MPRPKRTRTVTVEEPDILDLLEDLYRQATVERSHYYTGACVLDAIVEIKRLRLKCGETD